MFNVVECLTSNLQSWVFSVQSSMFPISVHPRISAVSGYAGLGFQGQQSWQPLICAHQRISVPSPLGVLSVSVVNKRQECRFHERAIPYSWLNQ